MSPDERSKAPVVEPRRRSWRLSSVFSSRNRSRSGQVVWSGSLSLHMVLTHPRTT